jgi:hypothetical protein
MKMTEALLRSRIRRILNEMHPGGEGGGWSGPGETRRIPTISPVNDAKKLINFVDHNPGMLGGDLEMAISSSKHDPLPLYRMLKFLIGMDNLVGAHDEYWAEIISKETGGRYTAPEPDPYGLRGRR